MLRRSQASFMNALTANDWTMYPFSTMNDADFQNLLRVYADAVFKPKLNELDFMQEGWRLEPKTLSDPSCDLQIKGVVFNEMKGVFSNSLNRFGQTVQNKLLPETYGYVSGGHPESIPTLTWESLKEFHRLCYHPSNACSIFLMLFSFYTYGDVGLEWCLEFLENEYLQHYDALELNNHIPLEPVWEAPRTVELTCEPDPMSPDPDRQCIISLSYRLEDIRNIYENFVLRLLSKLLLEGDNSPLYHGLIESGFGLDWAGGVCGMDQGARTTSLHVGVQGVRSAELTQFSQLTRDILTRVVRDGFPTERIEATLHQYELAVRHESARFGLNLIFALSHAVNHEVDVEQLLQIQNLIKRFRADLETNPSMLQNMVQKYILDNPHTLLTTMKPDESWRAKQSQRDLELHSKITDAVSPSERADWVTKSQKLLEQQQLEEDVSCLPCLRLLDIPMECRREPFTMTEAAGCPVQLNEAPTNKLVYFHGLADLSTLPMDLLIYVPLFCDLFPRLGADDLTYLEMDQAIDLHTGGLSLSAHVTPVLPTQTTITRNTSTAVSAHISGYGLEEKMPKFFELWSKLLRAPTWSDKQRLTTLIMTSASGDWSANAIADSAHRFAMRRAAANLSATCRVHELWYGLEQAMLIKQLGNKLGKKGPETESALNDLIARMVTIWKHIADSTRLRFSLHGDSDGLCASLPYLENLISSIPQTAPSASVNSSFVQLAPLPQNAYFVMPYTVHYVGQAFSAPSYVSPDYAAFRVLAQLVGSKYLHREIREKGGAYGGRALAKPETFLLFSYRDPRAHGTLDTFRQALSWAQSAEFATQDLDEAKLSVFQEVSFTKLQCLRRYCFQDLREMFLFRDSANKFRAI
ncbi:presequence protease [Paragonimus westermani]|uniref:Presequence protease n=1 Tax=Paragonimus westermani TaxID=34504 RepID=A0A5J4NPN2_9TREM|nr:presequence protease [Paragonimus westermani]